MTVDEFRAAGEKIFGESWQRQLAEYFNVGIDEVRKWASGRYPVPPWMATELAGVRMLLLLPRLIDLLVDLTPAEGTWPTVYGDHASIIQQLEGIQADLNREDDHG